MTDDETPCRADFIPLPEQAVAKLDELRRIAGEAQRRVLYLIEDAANVLEVPKGYEYDPKRRGFQRPKGPEGTGSRAPPGGRGSPVVEVDPGDDGSPDGRPMSGDPPGGRTNEA